MNGHLQLSISLKNHDEIENAITLLKSLLPEEPSQMDVNDAVRMSMINTPWKRKRRRIRTRIGTAVGPATKGDLVYVKVEEPIIPKPKMLPNDKIVENLKKSESPIVKKDSKKYAYNQYGRFLRKKKVSKK